MMNKSRTRASDRASASLRARHTASERVYPHGGVIARCRKFSDAAIAAALKTFKVESLEQVSGDRSADVRHWLSIREPMFLAWETPYSPNLVVNTGLVYTHGTSLLAVAQITTWYCGLTDGTPTVAATDTSASHAGWVEVTAYTEGALQTWSGVSSGTGTSDNSAAPATFSINGSTTVGGVFLNSVSTKPMSTGTLYSVVAFTGGDRVLVNLDSLEITYNQSHADDGA